VGHFGDKARCGIFGERLERGDPMHKAVFFAVTFGASAHAREAWVCTTPISLNDPTNAWIEGSKLMFRCSSCSDTGVWNILEENSDHVLAYRFTFSSSQDKRFRTRYIGYTLVKKKSGIMTQFFDSTSEILHASGRREEPPDLTHLDCTKSS
jgi:hypothetical protein